MFLIPDTEGCQVIIPHYGKAISFGKTPDEAFTNAKDALALILEDEKEPVPPNIHASHVIIGDIELDIPEPPLKEVRLYSEEKQAVEADPGAYCNANQGSENGMITTEHIQTASDSLDNSDGYFAEGDELQGSERTWGAAAHAVMAIAQQRGWRYGDHRSLKLAVSRPASDLDDLLLETTFGATKKSHTNLHHKFMQRHEFDRDPPAVRLFVQRIQSLTDSG